MMVLRPRRIKQTCTEWGQKKNLWQTNIVAEGLDLRNRILFGEAQCSLPSKTRPILTRQRKVEGEGGAPRRWWWGRRPRRRCSGGTPAARSSRPPAAAATPPSPVGGTDGGDGMGGMAAPMGFSGLACPRDRQARFPNRDGGGRRRVAGGGGADTHLGGGLLEVAEVDLPHAEGVVVHHRPPQPRHRGVVLVHLRGHGPRVEDRDGTGGREEGGNTALFPPPARMRRPHAAGESAHRLCVVEKNRRRFWKN